MYHACRSMIAVLPPNEKRTPSTVVRFPRKVRQGIDALHAVYTTHQPEGTGGCLSVAPLAKLNA